MTIGELISIYCDEQAISFRQFAERSGLTSGYISMLVNNRNPKTGKPPVPTVKTYQKIADAMGMTMNDLLSETEKDTPSYYHTVTKGEQRHIKEKANSRYKNLADAIVEKLRETDGLNVDEDDEIWEMREDMRRNPELRTLFDLQRKATKSELRQMEAFIRAIRSSNDYDD